MSAFCAQRIAVGSAEGGLSVDQRPLSGLSAGMRRAAGSDGRLNDDRADEPAVKLA